MKVCSKCGSDGPFKKAKNKESSWCKECHQLYDVWRHMKERCSNPSHHKWSSYGGRGIMIHKNFLSFDVWREYMGPRPKGYQLDRIDNNGHYEPGNVRWATRSQQMNNRRNTFNITYMGKTKPASEWSQELGIDIRTIHSRLKEYGYNPEKLLQIPVDSSFSSDDKKKAFDLFDKGLSYRQIARQIGCSHVSIFKWVKSR